METMKSMFFACALLLGSAETFSAENLVLSEDFESQTFPPSGWVVKGTELSEDLESGYAHWSLNWNEVTGCSIAGSGCAEVMSDFKEGQAGISKEEWLITPAVQVADNASLSFTFWCNAHRRYRFRRRRFPLHLLRDDGQLVARRLLQEGGHSLGLGVSDQPRVGGPGPQPPVPLHLPG